MGTTTTSTTTTTTTAAASPTNEPPNPFRIPPGLVCKKHQTVTDRIIGGLTAVPNSWPWIFDINFWGSYCAGTIIDDKSVLTAAHCCKGLTDRPERITMTIGEHDVFNNDAGQRTFIAEQVIMHPNYQTIGILNDVCVLKFNSAGNINLKAHNSDAVCLPSPGFEPAHGTRCWSAGWGLMTSPHGGREMAEKLQEVDLQIYSHEECEKTQNSGYLVESAHLSLVGLKVEKTLAQATLAGPSFASTKRTSPFLLESQAGVSDAPGQILREFGQECHPTWTGSNHI